MPNEPAIPTPAQLLRKHPLALVATATAKERQARELAEGEVAVMREALEKVFHYLGRQIKAKTLNESARDGTQSLSLEVAQLLDGKKL